MRAAVWRTHAGIIVGRNLALLGADPNCAVCTLSRAGPPVDSPTFYGWPHAFAIAGANHDDQIGFLPVGENVKAAPFQQRLLNALARYGVGIGLVQRFSRIGINPTRTVLACTKYAGTRGLFLSLASAGVTSSVASVKKAEKRET